MNILDIVTILLFSLGIVIVGLAFSRRGKNMKSFFAGGGAMPWSMSGLSLFMGFFSAGTFVVWGSIAYLDGWVSVMIQWTIAIAGFLVGTFIAPKWHKTGALTAAEYITNRLGVKTQKTYTYLFLFISLFLTASFLYPVAKILEVSTGIPLNSCLLLLGGLCILYVSAGGLWAVVCTDILQFLILTAAVVIVIPLSFDRVEGLMSFIHSAPSGFFRLVNDEYTPGFMIAFGFYNAIFLGGNWAYVQRYTCVKTSRDARKVGWFVGLLYLISPVLWMLPPMVYRICEPGLTSLEAEGAYLLICREILPHGLLGMMIAGMIFATTSALNSKLNIASGVLTNDLFKRLRPQSSDQVLMRVARWSTVAFGVVTVLIAMLIPRMGGVVNVVISLAALTGVPLYLPVIWTLFSKRQTGRSILITTLLGLAVNGVFKFLTPLAGFSLDRSQEMILGVVFPVLCMIGFEIYYNYKKSVSPYYESYLAWEKGNRERNRSVTEQQQKAEEQDNKFSLKVIGYGISCVGLGIALLGSFSPAGRVLIIGMGGLFVGLGIYLVRQGAKTV